MFRNDGLRGKAAVEEGKSVKVDASSFSELARRRTHLLLLISADPPVDQSRKKIQLQLGGGEARKREDETHMK